MSDDFMEMLRKGREMIEKARELCPHRDVFLFNGKVRVCPGCGEVGGKLLRNQQLHDAAKDRDDDRADDHEDDLLK